MTGAATVNVATHLAAMSQARPCQIAVAFPQARDRRGRTAYTQLTFKQLHEQSDRLATFLDSIGVRQGMRTVLMVPPSLDFFTLTFALFKIGGRSRSDRSGHGRPQPVPLSKRGTARGFHRHSKSTFGKKAPWLGTRNHSDHGDDGPLARPVRDSWKS